jgi:hypothetical protein
MGTIVTECLQSVHIAAILEKVCCLAAGLPIKKPAITSAMDLLDRECRRWTFSGLAKNRKNFTPCADLHKERGKRNLQNEAIVSDAPCHCWFQ